MESGQWRMARLTGGVAGSLLGMQECSLRVRLLSRHQRLPLLREDREGALPVLPARGSSLRSDLDGTTHTLFLFLQTET